MTSNPRNLAALSPGQAGTIAKLDGERPFRRRLLELGLLPGTEVRVVNRAPLGDPLEIEVRGCRLSIRVAEARSIALADDGTGTAVERRSLDVIG